ncbi:MAG: CPBP family intramembrane metalloprotease [Candidatus Pacebacteria bacterium]|nr:CPBP family intramembrane metalloprotease [Candidatus Paceibacterota bacterium]
MPSQKRKKPTKFKNIPRINHKFFWPLVILVGVLWFIYRALFNFSVFFDETIGKAIFFGFPVLLYISVSNFIKIKDSLDLNKMHKGMLLGIAYGGIYGFAAAITSYAINKHGVQAVDLFSSSAFWWEFFLALLTAFWETIFFFSFIMMVLEDRMKKWSLTKLVLVTAAIFAIFHAPNAILRFDLSLVIAQVALMFIFGLGQALLFSKEKNAYALMISHAIWGMVLLVHWG